MQIYPDMMVDGSLEELAGLLDRIDMTPISGWHRDKEAEADIVPMLLGTEEIVRCFRASASEEAPGARLWLDIENSKWKITNIVPVGPDSLSPGTYRSLLLSFRNSLHPLIRGTNIEISEPVSDVGPEYWLEPKAIQLLHSFSILANKSTGASHPRDRARWNAFVIEANKRADRLAADELAQILVEHEDWPEDKANELALLFEYESSLLNDFANAS